jgi:poly(3-hydroxybutyrate) depolymerase
MYFKGLLTMNHLSRIIFSMTVLAMGCKVAICQEAEVKTYIPDQPKWAKIIRDLPNPVEIRTFKVDGIPSACYVYIPEHSKPLPLLLILGGDTGVSMTVRHYAPHAEQNKYIAVWILPAGRDTKDAFDKKRAAAGIPAGRQGNLQTLKQVILPGQGKRLRTYIADVEERAKVDRSRIFATGLSIGGIRCHLIASESSDLIAGIVPGISSYYAGIPFNAKQPVSMLCVTAEQDSRIKAHVKSGLMLPVETTTNNYVKLNGITGQPQVRHLQDKDEQDGMSVRVESYQSGKNGALLESWVVEGGDHAAHGLSWEDYMPEKFKLANRPACHDFYLPDVVWEFCKKCPPRKLPAQID